MAHVVVCGAGIAGISTAYNLTVRYGIQDVIVVDPLPPLSLTSDKSTEAYRNFWPGPDDSMIGLMNHSIALMEDLARASDNRFLLNRRGYVYATARPDIAEDLLTAAQRASDLGAGPLRVHDDAQHASYVPSPAEGFTGTPPGMDVLADPNLVREHFPYLNPDTRLVLHVRTAGWLSAQQLGMLMWEQARERGARLLQGEVVGVDTRAGRISHVWVRTEEGNISLPAEVFVNAAGPFVDRVAALAGGDLPIIWERHLKVAFNDHLKVIPRRAPLLIWNDPQYIPWDEEERAFLQESEEGRRLLEEFPPGVHTRPEGAGDSTVVLMLWDYDVAADRPTFPVEEDPVYPDVVLRGLTTMIPGLRVYWDRAPRPVVDGGYYTKTRENLPLIGPVGGEGAFVIGALSGFGIMAACGAGDILARYITGAEVPPFARAFHPARYTDPAWYPNLQAWGSEWQL